MNFYTVLETLSHFVIFISVYLHSLRSDSVDGLQKQRSIKNCDITEIQNTL